MNAAPAGSTCVRTFVAGCRKSKVKVAKVYLGVPGSHYPNPDLDLRKEVQSYESEFAKMKDELADVEFVADEMVSSADQLGKWKAALKDVDGSAERLWKNWSDGIHRVTCYGDLTKDLEHLCRFKQIDMINEAT